MSPLLSSPRKGITVSSQPTKSHSLQAIYFQQNTHSFPQRRQPIPRSFNHLRTLLPLTANIFSRSHFFSPTPLFLTTSFQRLHFHAIRHSLAQRCSGIPSVLNTLLSRHYLVYPSPRYTLNPRRFNLLQPLCSLFSAAIFCFQQLAASFAKTPGVGVSPQNSSLKSGTYRLFFKNTRSGGAARLCRAARCKGRWGAEKVSEPQEIKFLTLRRRVRSCKGCCR